MSGILLGPRALIDLAVPTGVDAGEIMRIQMQDGMTAAQAIAIAAQKIGEANMRLNDRYGGLVNYTESIFSRTRQGEGTRTMTPVEGEFSVNPGVRSDQIGSMLPLVDFEDSVEWSRRWLERANLDMVVNDLELIAERWEARVDYDVLLRLFYNSENLIGSSGYDVPFAVGTGNSVNYIPPAWMGYTFDANHTHYKYADAAVSAASLAAMINVLSDQVRHHGHTGRLTALVSDSDISYFTAAMTGFVPLVTFNPLGVGTTNLTQYAAGEVSGVPGELIGYFNSTRGPVEIRYHARIPTGYLAVFKSYGVNSPKNPLSIRVEPKRGFGLVPEPMVDRSLSPKLDKLMFTATHGVGVNVRTSAALGYIASGASAYVNPTIT